MILSVVILNYDTFELTQQCVESIVEYAPQVSYEIVIVNNGSRRDSAEQLASLHPTVRVLHLPANVGFGQANNLGVSRAHGRYVLLLNSDTYFVDNSLQIAYDYAESHPELDIIGCDVLNPDGSPQKCTFEFEEEHPAIYPMRLYFHENPLVVKLSSLWPSASNDEGKSPPEDSKPYGLYGCYVWIKRDVYKRTQGFDPDFYLYGEEIDWFRNRILPQKHRIGRCPKAKVVHIGKASQAPDAWPEQKHLSSFLLFYKIGILPFLAATAGLTLNLCTRIVLAPFMRAFRANLESIRLHARLLKRALLDVARYPRGFASRPIPLMIARYEKEFSWSRLTESWEEYGLGSRKEDTLHEPTRRPDPPSES